MWGMATADVQDEIYEVNHCSEREEMPNQVERRWRRMEWTRVSKATDRSRRQIHLLRDSVRKMVM